MRNEIRWYECISRNDENERLRKCIDYEVEGVSPRGRPKKTWREIVKKSVGHNN